MSETEDLRALAFAVAYRMLGSVAEAEDVAQEALLRLHGAEDVQNPSAFLTTATTRLAIDVLRSARVRREAYTGSWLPEPLVEDDAERRVEDEEAVSLAFLVLLERLSPDERAVLVLRESFDYPFDEIAEILGTSPANCRQILSRARRRIDDDRPRFDPDPRERRRLAARFLAAARDGDMDGLLALLAPVADQHGAARVARAILAFYGQVEEWGVTLEPVLVNGQPGFRTIAPDDRLVNVVSIDVEGGAITRLQAVLNPDKLGHLGPLSDLGLRPVRETPPR